MRTGKAPVEYELKFEIGEYAFERLRRRRKLEGLDLSLSSMRLLRSIYFDTPSMALWKAGISMRVRRVGKDWVQTVKVGTALNAGLSTPLEDEGPVPTDKPDLQAVSDDAIRDRLTASIGKDCLEPVFETTIERTTRTATGARGSVAEIALDRGEIRQNGQSHPFKELEIEHKAGIPSDIFITARALLKGIPCRISQFGKAERGYRHLNGLDCDHYQPRYARTPKISRSMNAEQGLQAILRECAAQIGLNLAAIAENDDPEGAHQFRIGLRRLRTALRTYRPLIDGPGTRDILTRARRLGASAGRLRDADVLITDIVEPIRIQAEDAVDFTELYECLLAQREATQALVRDQLNASGIAFLLDLIAYNEGRFWLRREDHSQAKKMGGGLKRFARYALTKHWNRIERSAQQLESLSIEQRHDLRKDLKQLRYCAEFFAPIYGRRKTKKFLKCQKRLLSVFGYLNDVALAQNIHAESSLNPDIKKALGFVLGWHTCRAELAWTGVADHWMRANSAKKFWI